VIHGGTQLFDASGDKHQEFTYGQPSLEKFLSGMTFSQPAAFFRRSFLQEVGLLREDLHFGMDYDLFARLACVCEFKGNQDLYSKYRLHDASKSVAHSEKFRKDWNQVYYSICHHLQWNDIVKELEELLPGLIRSPYPYTFLPDKNIVEKADRRKSLFYFISDLMLHDYWYDHHNEARKLYLHLRNNFPLNWLDEDPRVKAVVMKLRLPPAALGLMKKVKGFSVNTKTASSKSMEFYQKSFDLHSLNGTYLKILMSDLKLSGLINN
jgi:hypothetical protein